MDLINRKVNHILKTTEDGSNTFFVPELNEHYHSTHGAIQESMHIFINAGLLHSIQENNKQNINILEIGFGTGLNALLTLLQTIETPLNLFYNSLELYPISNEEVNKLNFSNQLSRSDSDELVISDLFLKLHSSPWEESVNITSNFKLLKQKIDFSRPASFYTDKKFDIIYFDAFAPEKQPEMWTQEIFSTIYNLCKEGAVLTTYCAKGAVRRMLNSAGFKVDRLPGPPGKREVLRGHVV